MKVAPTDRELIVHRRVEQVLLAVAGAATVAVAVAVTAAVATDPQPGALPVVGVALFAVVATLGGLGVIIGIRECQAEIRRERRR